MNAHQSRSRAKKRNRDRVLFGAIAVFATCIGTFTADQVLLALEERELRGGEAAATAATSLDHSQPGVPTMKPMGINRLENGTHVWDFTLPRVQDGAPVHLADLHEGKPVVLIISSFT